MTPACCILGASLGGGLVPSRVRLAQHPDQHRSERPVLLAVD
jgi:hypothetical protein